MLQFSENFGDLPTGLGVGEALALALGTALDEAVDVGVTPGRTVVDCRHPVSPTVTPMAVATTATRSPHFATVIFILRQPYARPAQESARQAT
jgi:hypothetical protein